MAGFATQVRSAACRDALGATGQESVRVAGASGCAEAAAAQGRESERGGGAEGATPVVLRIDRRATHAASKAEMMSKFGFDSDSTEEDRGAVRSGRGASSKGEGVERGHLGAPESESEDDFLAMMDG